MDTAVWAQMQANPYAPLMQASPLMPGPPPPGLGLYGPLPEAQRGRSAPPGRPPTGPPRATPSAPPVKKGLPLPKYSHGDKNHVPEE
ncbi:hypothetical protein HDZ31DRAFT_68764 [Schizophyllum fasciatum]